MPAQDTTQATDAEQPCSDLAEDRPCEQDHNDKEINH
tara:strand:+ start:2842 stop:2952 length:111 start_codon:yes stop_codon:yes gene_type:complete